MVEVERVRAKKHITCFSMLHSLSLPTIMYRTILKKLREIVGSENFFDSPEHRFVYSYDATPLHQALPEAIVAPRSIEQVCQIMRLANEEHFAIVPRGSGTGLSGGSVPVENCIVLLTNHWNQILEIDQENLTVTVEPGVITGHLQAEVEKLGLLYPPDPGSSSICTIGGNVAENAGGLRGLKYGVTKNYVMGLEFVSPSGEVIFAGGKNVKDVAGYNLKDLLIGSEGTLGIFMKILLRLVPKPEASRTLLVFFESLRNSAETVSQIISAKITPAALEFLDNTTIRCVEDYAALGLPKNIEALLLIELDGRSGEVENDLDSVSKICRANNALNVKVAMTELEAIQLRLARKAAFASLARMRPTTILEDVTVPRSEIAPMLEKIKDIAQKHDLMFGNFGHAGDGNLHPTCLTDENDKDEIRRTEKAFEEIFSEAVRRGGTITGEHGVGLSKRAFLGHAIGSASVELMRQIKASFDPNMVLNPGKIFSKKPRCEGPLPISRKELQKYIDLGAYH